jgi:hypothetical protein
MAKRKYKRDKNGRFAGGSGGSSSSRSTSAAPKGSAAAKARKRQANPGGTTFRAKAANGAKRAGKSVGKFAKENPRLVTTAVVYGGLHAGAAMNQAKIRRGMSQATKLINEAARNAQKMASDKRGIGGRPGANLKRKRRNLRGAYNVRSF